MDLDAQRPSLGYIAQWLERLTADQQVPGSNPGVPSRCKFPLRHNATHINASVHDNAVRLHPIATHRNASAHNKAVTASEAAHLAQAEHAPCHSEHAMMHKG